MLTIYKNNALIILGRMKLKLQALIFTRRIKPLYRSEMCEHTYNPIKLIYAISIRGS